MTLSRILRVFIALAVVAGLAAFGLALSKKVGEKMVKLEATRVEAVQKAKPAAVTPPKLVQPVPGPATRKLLLTGTLAPEAEVELGFRLSGRVIHLGAVRGQTVLEGDVLAHLDVPDLEAQEAQARAAIRTARARRNLAADLLERSKKLHEAGAATEQQLASASGQASISAAGIAQAAASVKVIEAMKESAVIVAPFGGVVVRAPTSRGFVANPGAPLIRLEKLDRLRFTGHLSEVDAARVSLKMPVTVRSETGATASGEISLILGSLDPRSRRVPIEALVPNPEGRLFAGSLVEAELEVAADPAVLVPTSALLGEASPAVLVVGADGLLAKRSVVLDGAADGKVRVLEGLTTADQVVAEPGKTWREGARADGKAVEAAPEATK